MDKKEHQEFEQRIEAYIDRYDVEHLLTLIACICREKSDHIMANYQDIRLAAEWEREAKKIEKLCK